MIVIRQRHTRHYTLTGHPAGSGMSLR